MWFFNHYSLRLFLPGGADVAFLDGLHHFEAAQATKRGQARSALAELRRLLAMIQKGDNQGSILTTFLIC